MEQKRILFVDDEANILTGIQRQLRKEFNVETALGPREGVKAITSKKEEYAVVVADMNMPEMNGVEFLSQVRLLAPEIVRIMLTGNADQQTAVDAVNEGCIFRFLSKPCAPEKLSQAIQAGLRQHQLITAERDLLEKTVAGIVNTFNEIIRLAAPKTAEAPRDLREELRQLAQTLQVPDSWQIELASILSRIGCVAVPPAVALKRQIRQELTPSEREVLARIPEMSANLVANIPRLEQTARIIRYSKKNFDGSGLPADGCANESIPIGARLLRVVNDLAEYEQRGVSRAQAFAEMKQRTGVYDPKVLDAAQASLRAASAKDSSTRLEGREVTLGQLRQGQILRSDLRTADGALLMNAGTRLSDFTLDVISTFARMNSIREPILVEDPVLD